RHIVADSEIAELCTRIYRKHQRALDLIYEHRPDRQSDIRGILEDLVRQTPILVPDHSSKSYIRFAPGEWDVPTLLSGQRWTQSGRMLLFEFQQNTQTRLPLKLLIGPGPTGVRQELLNLAIAAQ